MEGTNKLAEKKKKNFYIYIAGKTDMTCSSYEFIRHVWEFIEMMPSNDIEVIGWMVESFLFYFLFFKFLLPI